MGTTAAALSATHPELMRESLLLISSVISSNPLLIKADPYTVELA